MNTCFEPLSAFRARLESQSDSREQIRVVVINGVALLYSAVAPAGAIRNRLLASYRVVTDSAGVDVVDVTSATYH